MTYMRKGGLIRMAADRDVPRFVAQGFVKLETGGEKPAKKSVRKQKEADANGGA